MTKYYIIRAFDTYNVFVLYKYYNKEMFRLKHNKNFYIIIKKYLPALHLTLILSPDKTFFELTENMKNILKEHIKNYEYSNWATDDSAQKIFPSFNIVYLEEKK